jgi:hypothetical protein
MLALRAMTLATPASAQGVLNVYCSVQVEWCTLIANEFGDPHLQAACSTHLSVRGEARRPCWRPA